MEPESSSASAAPSDSLAAAVSRIVQDLVESGSDRVARLLQQASNLTGNLTGSLVEAAGALLGALIGGSDGPPETMGQLMGGVGGLLGGLAQELFQMLGGSGEMPARSDGPGGLPPVVPAPPAPAGPGGFAPPSFSSAVGASGSAADPLFFMALCSFGFVLLQGGKLAYQRGGPGRLRSTALRLVVERPG